MPRYFPYFRARQEELLAIIEAAPALQGKDVVHVLEPVNNVSSLARRARDFVNHGCQLAVVVNPRAGDEESRVSPESAATVVRQLTEAGVSARPALIVDALTTPRDVLEFVNQWPGREVVAIHFGQPFASEEIADRFRPHAGRAWHLIVEGKTSAATIERYGRRATLRDGFVKRARNADYPNGAREFFSDKHRTATPLYEGFGDFSTVGAEYFEGGGPPRAVALHLTEYADGDVHCRHFVSVTGRNTPAGTSAKYAEAVRGLADFVEANAKAFAFSTACPEFVNDARKGLNTSLGMMKRRSMRHHLELMARLL